LNWSVALETTVPEGLSLPPMEAGVLAGNVNVPEDPVATAVTGVAVLPYGAHCTVTFVPTREQVTRYHAPETTFVGELANTWPPGPRTRHEG
jgi:hypothetical protein